MFGTGIYIVSQSATGENFELRTWFSIDFTMEIIILECKIEKFRACGAQFDVKSVHTLKTILPHLAPYTVIDFMYDIGMGLVYMRAPPNKQ